MATGNMIPDPPAAIQLESSAGIQYPPAAEELREERRAYKDEAAVELFKKSGGPNLALTHSAMIRALAKQAEKLEQHFNTPFTKKQTQTMLVTMEGIERMERLLERWHLLIYPNQRPAEGHDVG